jgi:hypothetical protein
LLVLSTDLASNGGSLSASMAHEVFLAKNSSYASELLHARDSCGDPGTAHAGKKSFPAGNTAHSSKNIWIQAIFFFSFEMEIVQ